MKPNCCIRNWFPQPNALNLVTAEHSGQTYKGICFVKGKRSCSLFFYCLWRQRISIIFTTWYKRALNHCFQFKTLCHLKKKNHINSCLPIVKSNISEQPTAVNLVRISPQRTEWAEMIPKKTLFLRMLDLFDYL